MEDFLSFLWMGSKIMVEISSLVLSEATGLWQKNLIQPEKVWEEDSLLACGAQPTVNKNRVVPRSLLVRKHGCPPPFEGSAIG